jgi:hypothetical protein
MVIDMEEKIQLNKKIRSYGGANTFILSLQKKLKSTKANKVVIGNKTHKVLSDKQYEVAKNLL